MERKSSFWKGAGVGFLIGGTGGVVLGLTGKDWILPSGKIVPRFPHAVVDALIVGVPAALIGGIVGLRADRSSLERRRFHIGIHGGWSSVMTYNNMLDAFNASGISADIPHWFGYLHYPDGDNSSTPYTWNLTADYNIIDHLSVGFSFNNFVRQEIKRAGNKFEPVDDIPHEYTMGESYSLLVDGIINPIKPENKTRLQVSAGAGISLHRLIVGGRLESPESKFKLAPKKTWTPHFRAALDYFSRKDLSLQLKAGYKPKQEITVPEQVDPVNPAVVLKEHNINFRALDITIGVRYHFNL